MSDYISREALIKAIEGNPYVTDSVKSYVRCTARSIPAADVRPVVRGKWIEFVGSAYHGVDDDGEVKWRDVSIFHCDKCGRKTVVKENFCPHCGADMREDEHE